MKDRFSLSQNFNRIQRFYRRDGLRSCHSFAGSYDLTQRNVRKDQFLQSFITKTISGRHKSNWKRTTQAGNSNLQEIHSENIPVSCLGFMKDSAAYLKIK